MSFTRSSAAAAAAALIAGLGLSAPLAAVAAPGDPVAGQAYSQGWYKTHAAQWPCAVSSSTPFFESGLTLHQVLTGNVSKGVFFQLGQQYVAAGVNEYNGAIGTPEVSDAMAAAREYFSTATPATPLTKQQTAELKALIPVLSDYNTAVTTVGSAPACEGELFQTAPNEKGPSGTGS